jgi:hypothetical protein
MQYNNITTYINEMLVIAECITHTVVHFERSKIIFKKALRFDLVDTVLLLIQVWLSCYFTDFNISCFYHCTFFTVPILCLLHRSRRPVVYLCLHCSLSRLYLSFLLPLSSN